MEGLIFDPRIQWLAYLVSAWACFWAWNKMFFWIKQKDIKAIFRILGAVLLFTPAPLDVAHIELAAGNYAPAFIVIIFRKFLEDDAIILDAVMCMLVAGFVGLILMAVLSLVNYVWAKFSSADPVA